MENLEAKTKRRVIRDIALTAAALGILAGGIIFNDHSDNYSKNSKEYNACKTASKILFYPGCVSLYGWAWYKFIEGTNNKAENQ